ncbi:hypothetical protein D9M71_397390 [compost metagenome]
MQGRAPRDGSGRLRQAPVQGVQRIEELHQRADQRGVQAADLVVGLDAGAGRAAAHRVAEQHAAQTEAPGVLLQAVRQAQRGAAFGVQSPADAGALDPAVQGRQLALVDFEAGAQRRHVEQVEHLADGQAPFR